MDTEALDGGWNTRVRRNGDQITREARPSSGAVIGLLHFLETEGFDWAPRPVGTGFDASGDEVLTFIPGSSPQPFAWSDGAVAQVGAMLRELHDLTARYRPPS